MTAPVFIEIRRYRQVLDRADALKAHLMEINRLIKEIDRLRSEEQDHIQSTRKQLESMRAAISRVEEEV